MSETQIVADSSVVTRAPKFYKESPREWAEDLEIDLMTKTRLHLASDPRPAILAGNAAAKIRRQDKRGN
jgi:hypothetical protein